MIALSLCVAFNMLGLLGLLFGLLFNSGEDPRFAGDKLMYRS